jgi:hypothetical protein
MKISISVLMLASLMLSFGCSGKPGNTDAAANSGTAAKPATTGGGAIEVKLKDKTYKLEPKATWLFSDDWTINMPDGKAVPTATREIVIANYDLDTVYGKSSSMKKMTAPDQIRLVVQLQDKADVKKDMPISTGDYVGKIEEFSKIQNVFVYTFGETTDTRTLISGSNSDNKGIVKITTASGEGVTGEIDFSNTDNSFKGLFTAKIWKQSK